MRALTRTSLIWSVTKLVAAVGIVFLTIVS